MTVIYFDGDELPNDQKHQENTSIIKIGKEEDPGNNRSDILTSGPEKMVELLEAISRCMNAKTVTENRQRQFAFGESWLTSLSVFWN